MNESGYNAWRLVSLSPIPAWALVLLVLAAIASVVLAQRGLRKESRRGRRWALLALRTLAALSAVFMLLEPGVRLLQTTRVKNRLAVAVDRSGSMAFPSSPGGPSRAETTAQFFAQTLDAWKSMDDRFTLEAYAFDREASPVEFSRLTAPLEARGGRTDLLSAIRAAAEGSSGSGGRKLSGVVLISDGADNSQLEGGVTPEVKAELKGLGVPVNVVVVGQGGLKDLSVEKVAVDDFAFVRNPVTVEAEVRSHGFSGIEVPVVLKREGRVVATQKVMLHGDQERYPVSFPFSPDQTGQFVYTVSVPVLEGEAVTSNNSRSFVLKVIRDRMRVLLVVGRPSWDERFLRGLLKQDPNVDLISFFILRTSLDNPHARDDELSLIPFPVREIFDEQLKTFDIVIFQNFAHRDKSYNMEQYLGGIRDYIASGGAFAMVGGENSFGDGHYDQTPLAEALPVEMDGTAAKPEPFTVHLTEEGIRHPVTQVVSGAEQNAKLFAQLPPLPGLNMTHAKPNAQVLLEHSTLQEGGHGVPVLTLGEYGRGRVMALTTDGLWNWTLPSAATATPSRAYDKVWTQALRWLVKDPDLTTLRIQADRPMVEPGEPVAATVTLRKSDYGPAVDAPVQVELVQVDEGKVVQHKQVVTGTDGTARVEFGALPPGPYKMTAKAQTDSSPAASGSSPGEASDAVAVRAAGPELSDASARPELLKEIADATGGTVSELPRSSLPKMSLVEPEVVEVGARKDRPIWDNAWPLVLLVFAAGAEWALRRRWGYL
jgi:uncharacterized membrane protein